jgi:ABC-type antimicrobial peptide transport system permease subunit
LADTGFEVTTTTDRLDRFNAVPNTYLSTFQVLGGLGLLLGSVGLGVVVLRNVWERRGELAAMSAVGLSRDVLTRLVVNEHGGLLFTGLGLGFAAALVAVLPAFWNPGGGFPWLNVGVTLGLVLVNGLVWTWFAARRALAGDLLAALRGE